MRPRAKRRRVGQPIWCDQRSLGFGQHIEAHDREEEHRKRHMNSCRSLRLYVRASNWQVKTVSLRKTQCVVGWLVRAIGPAVGSVAIVGDMRVRNANQVRPGRGHCQSREQRQEDYQNPETHNRPDCIGHIRGRAESFIRESTLSSGTIIRHSFAFVRHSLTTSILRCVLPHRASPHLRCGRRAWSFADFRGRRWLGRVRGCRRFRGRR